MVTARDQPSRLAKDGAAPVDRPPNAPSVASLKIWVVAWPVILGHLLFNVVALADIKIVGVLGASAIAAVTTGTRVFALIQGLLTGLTIGATTLVSQASGRGDRAEAGAVTASTLVICVGAGVVLTFVGVTFAEQLVRVFRVDPTAVEAAAAFLRQISWFGVSFAIQYGFIAAVRGAGDTRTPLYVGLSTNIVNIILCYGFVNGAFGLPSMGTTGAALATGLAYTINTGAYLALWFSRRLLVKPPPFAMITRERVRSIFRIGAPGAGEQLVFQGALITFMWLISFQGTAAFAAYGIGVSVLAFSIVIGYGIGSASAIVVGHHVGAGDINGAAREGWAAARLAAVVMSAIGVLIAVAAGAIARFISTDADVIQLTVWLIYVLALAQPLIGIDSALAGALRGAGDTRFVLFSSASGLFGARLLVGGGLTLAGAPAQWVFCALLVDYVVKSSLTAWRFNSRRWAPKPPGEARATR
jgi:putative MATE family efflux protein